jgi:hypothetical protein
MDRTLFAIFLGVAIFVGYEAGYSLAPFVDAGVFSARKEKGVESRIDDAMKRHYEQLYRDESP